MGVPPPRPLKDLSVRGRGASRVMEAAHEASRAVSRRPRGPGRGQLQTPRGPLAGDRGDGTRLARRRPGPLMVGGGAR